MNGLFSNLLKKLTSADKIDFECVKRSTALMLSVIAKVDSLPSSQDYPVPPAIKLKKMAVESIQKFLKEWLVKGGVIGSNRFGGDDTASWYSYSHVKPKLNQEVEVSMIVVLYMHSVTS